MRGLRVGRPGRLAVDLGTANTVVVRRGAGVVLFECLAGRPPFPGDNVPEVLRQHLTVKPPELRRLGLPVPLALEEVIQRLQLKAELTERPPAARAAQ